MPDLKWLRYGNWCGPGPAPPADPAAKNDVDAVCRRHDLSYRQCGVTGLAAIKAALPGRATACTYPQDSTFIDELKALLDRGDLEGSEQKAAEIISRYFNWKHQKDHPADEPPDDRSGGGGVLAGFKKWLGNQGGGQRFGLA